MTDHDAAPAWLPCEVPTLHQLKAALIVAGRLETEPAPVAHVRNGYPRTPTDGVFSPEDLRVGEDILVAADWASREGAQIRLVVDGLALGADPAQEAKRLLTSYLAQHPPDWIGLVFRDESLDMEFIPHQALDALSATITDADEREAILLRLGGQFDDTYRRQLGLAGEQAVVRRCKELLTLHGRPDLAEQVLHVSLISDALGYDVRTPTLTGAIRKLEVKTTSRSEDHAYRIILSRNEAEKASQDEVWHLIVCTGWVGGEVDIAGSCQGASVVSLLPSDSEWAQWKSAEVLLDSELLTEGVPLG